jgi:glycosyltransferase involved in cell wall biosynthesis
MRYVSKKMKNDEVYIFVEPPLPINNLQSRTIDLEHPPLVSFIIPVYNSERTLEKCLRSIQNQDYPNKEIVIVDNGSSDNTLTIAKKFTDNIFFDDGLLGSVRQAGLDHMQGRIAGILDSDVYLPHKKWLSNAIQYFNYSDEIATIWPKTLAPPEGPSFQKLYFNLGSLIMEDRIKRNRGIVGGSGLLLKKAIDNVGGYDKKVHWGEDFDLALKLKNKGYKIIYLKDAVYHDTDMGLSISKFVNKQIKGASSLSTNSETKMNLSKKDMIYENIFLGAKGMINGLLEERDISWLLYPLLVILRIQIFLYVTLCKFLKISPGD